jgi:hypothetical protein
VELQADRRSHGRSALLLVDFAALAAGAGFLILGRLPWPWLEALVGDTSSSRLLGDRQRLIFSRERGPKLAALSLLVHVLTVVIAWCVVRSIAAPVLFGQVFQLVPPVMLITMLPISIAGWGVRETTMGLAFGYAGPCDRRRRQRVAAVRLHIVYHRRIRRPGMDLQRRETSEGREADRSP